MACNECFDSQIENCSQGTGCTTTTYLKCVYAQADYCGGIIAGDNLDEILTKLCAYIATSVPGATDYSLFSYTNGTYTLQSGTTTANLFGGTGVSITTITGFVEAVTDATLNLHGRLDTLETPVTGTPCGLFTWNASTPLSQTIEDMAGKLCNLLTYIDSGLTFNNINGTITNPACFITTNSATTLAGIINWVTSNICSVNTLRVADIAASNLRIDSLETLTFGAGSNAPIDNSAYIACLSTGTASDDLKTTVVAVRNKVCSLNTSVTTLLAAGNTVSLTYNTCLTSPSGSSGATSATVLAHLNNIIAKYEGYTFGAGFIATPVGCETTITIDPAYAFACSSLNACDLSAHNDVTTYVSATLNGYSNPTALIWASADAKKTAGSGAWRAKQLIFQSSDASVTVTPTNNTNDVTVNLQVPAAAVSTINFSYPANTVTSTLTSSSGYPDRIHLIGNVVYIHVTVDISLGTWLSNTWRTIATITSAAGFPASQYSTLIATLTNNVTAAETGYGTIARVSSAGVIEVYNPLAVSIAPTGVETWTINIAGNSYLTI